MQIGVAADHGGFDLKERLASALRDAGHDVTDFGARTLLKEDDYPDYVAPLARAVRDGTLERGIVVCGSGVGACVAANKLSGVRAGLITDHFSAHQGVEDDDMNVICLGGRVVGFELAMDLVQAFISARYIGAERHRRRLDKVEALENGR